MSQILSSSVERTFQIGRELVQRIENSIGKKPIIFALIGELGSGKTHLVKGIAAELGIQDLILSPSYTLVNEYEFSWKDATLLFAHIDAWRLEELAHLEGLGWRSFLERNAVIALEWSPEKELLPLHLEAEVITVRIEYGKDPQHRLLRIDPEPLTTQ